MRIPSIATLSPVCIPGRTGRPWGRGCPGPGAPYCRFVQETARWHNVGNLPRGFSDGRTGVPVGRQPGSLLGELRPSIQRGNHHRLVVGFGTGLSHRPRPAPGHALELASGLSFVGLIHAERIGISLSPVTKGYLVLTAILALLYLARTRRGAGSGDLAEPAEGGDEVDAWVGLEAETSSAETSAV